MEIKINREIRNYQEAIFFGLTLRQFIFSVLAIGAAVGLYFGLIDLLGTEVTSWVCFIGCYCPRRATWSPSSATLPERISSSRARKVAIMPLRSLFP